MASRNLTISIVADTKELDRGFKKAETRLQSFGKKAGIAGAAIGGGLLAAMGASAKAAAEAEKSQKALEAQLATLGAAAKAHAGDIDRVIKKHSDLAAVDDEDLQGAFTNLIRNSKDVQGSLAQVGLVTDIAAAKNISLGKAGDIVGKAMAGNDAALKKLVPGLSKTATTQDILTEATKRFHGQAEKSGEGAAGAQRRYQNAIENLQESMGSGLLPVMTRVANAFAGMVGWLEKNRAVGTAVVAVAGTLATALIGLSVATKVSEGLKAMAKAQELLNTATRKHPFVAVGVALVALGAALVVAYQKSETFRRIVQAAFVAVLKGVTFVIDKILGLLSTWLDGMAKIARAASHLPFVGDKFKGVAEKIEGASDSVNRLREGIRKIPQKIEIDLKIAGLEDKLKKIKDLSTLPNITVTPRSVRRQTGGFVPGAGSGDIVPALLEPGEFVMRRKVVEAFGPTFFASMNAQQFANGGLVHRAAYAAGFRGNALRIAQAVAQAESGGNPKAIGDRNLGGSHGLWQVHLPSHPNYDPQRLFDPLYNARAAFAISGGGRNWQPWTTFRTGAYKRFLGQATITTPLRGTPSTPRATKPGISKGTGAGHIPERFLTAPAARTPAAPAGDTFTGVDLPGPPQFTSGTPKMTGTVFSSSFDYAVAWIAPQLERIDLLEGAGRITPAQANAQRRALYVQAMAQYGHLLSENDRLKFEGAIRQIDQQAKQDAAPDLQFELGQANRRTAVETARANISEASLSTFQGAGDISYGVNGRPGVTFIQNNQMLVPGSPQQMAQLAGATVQALDSQGGRTRTTHRSGY